MSDTKILSAEDILAADDVDVREEHVPEWGGTVLLRGLSGTDRDAYEASLTMQRGDKTIPDPRNMRAKLVGRAIVKDDRKTRAFTDQQISALGAKNGAVLDRLFEVVADMSGLSNGAVEDAEGNSEGVQSDASISE